MPSWFRRSNVKRQTPTLRYCTNCMRAWNDLDLEACPTCGEKLTNVKFRSGSEGKRAMLLSESGIRWRYEADVVEWQPPSQKYKPDFTIYPEEGDPYFEEIKGWFQPEDRIKMAEIKKQHPELDIRMVFDNTNGVIRKRKDGTRYTNADWCEQYGFRYYSVGRDGTSKSSD